MDRLLNVLSPLELGLATSAVYDLVNINGGRADTLDELAAAIQDQFNMYGVPLSAETVIETLKKNGLLAERYSVAMDVAAGM